MIGSDRDAMDFDTGMAILSTYDASGFLGIGVDVYGGQTAGTGVFDAKFPYGTFGRPRDPVVSDDGATRTGATVLWAYNGKQRLAWPLDDPRVWPKLPQASKGTWGAFGDTGRDDITVMVLDGTTGSFALRVPHAGSGVSRVLVDVGTPGAEEILLANGGGCEIAVKPLETVVGENALALALAKATSVQGIVSALQALATSFIAFGPPTPPSPLTPLAAIGTTLQLALAAIPPIPTTKLRSE